MAVSCDKKGASSAQVSTDHDKYYAHAPSCTLYVRGRVALYTTAYLVYLCACVAVVSMNGHIT